MKVQMIFALEILLNFLALQAQNAQKDVFIFNKDKRCQNIKDMKSEKPKYKGKSPKAAEHY